jgi:hypothetical protein
MDPTDRAVARPPPVKRGRRRRVRAQQPVTAAAAQGFADCPLRLLLNCFLFLTGPEVLVALRTCTGWYMAVTGHMAQDLWQLLFHRKWAPNPHFASPRSWRDRYMERAALCREWRLPDCRRHAFSIPPSWTAVLPRPDDSAVVFGMAGGWLAHLALPSLEDHQFSVLPPSILQPTNRQGPGPGDHKTNSDIISLVWLADGHLVYGSSDGWLGRAAFHAPTRALCIEWCRAVAETHVRIAALAATATAGFLLEHDGAFRNPSVRSFDLRTGVAGANISLPGKPLSLHAPLGGTQLAVGLHKTRAGSPTVVLLDTTNPARAHQTLLDTDPLEAKAVALVAGGRVVAAGRDNDGREHVLLIEAGSGTHTIVGRIRICIDGLHCSRALRVSQAPASLTPTPGPSSPSAQMCLPRHQSSWSLSPSRRPSTSRWPITTPSSAEA